MPSPTGDDMYHNSPGSFFAALAVSFFPFRRGTFKSLASALANAYLLHVVEMKYTAPAGFPYKILKEKKTCSKIIIHPKQMLNNLSVDSDIY